MLACPPQNGGSDRRRDLVGKPRETMDGPRPPCSAPSRRRPHSSFRLKGLRWVQPGRARGLRPSRWRPPARTEARGTQPGPSRRGSARHQPELRVADLCRPMRAGAGSASAAGEDPGDERLPCYALRPDARSRHTTMVVFTAFSACLHSAHVTHVDCVEMPDFRPPPTRSVCMALAIRHSASIAHMFDLALRFP